MKPKTIFLILAFVVLCGGIWLAYVNLFDGSSEDTNMANSSEITPGEEMTEEQERQTMISLYYTNTETNTLMPEAKVIDAKDLLENPYKTLFEFLIAPPKNDKLKSSVPEGTKLNGAVLNGDVLTIDLTKEFVNGQSDESMKLAMYSIVNTLTELNEVGSIKFIIDGEENVKVEGTNITLQDTYIRQSTEENTNV